MRRNKIKLLVFSHMFPNLQNPIAGTFVREELKELAKQCEAKVIAPVPYAPPVISRFKRRWELFSMTPGQEWIDGIEVLRPRVPMLPANKSLAIDGFSYYLCVLRTVKKLRGRFDFDIIHAHSIIPDGFGAALVARKMKKPLVLSIHGRELHRSFKTNRLIEKEIAFSIANASAVVMGSSEFLNRLNARFPGIPGNKTSVIHYGFDTETFHRGRKPAAGKGRSFTLLTVASLLKIKGHEHVLRALSDIIPKNPAMVYQIVGQGPEEGRLKGLCNSLGIEKNVFFLGRKSRGEVADYMANCDAFIMTSTDEGFGCVYLEAMSQGKPVIGSLGQGIGDLIEDGVNGFLVEPTDHGAIASRIRSLADDAGLRERFGGRARDLVWNEYTWAQNALKYMNLYERILGRDGHEIN